MIPTIVYANTHLPYEMWLPAYVILGSWDKSTFRSVWMEWSRYQKAKPEAEHLIQQYWKDGRWGKRSFNTSRWRKDICQDILTIINSNVEGLKGKVEYPSFEENHCRVFILER